MKKLKAFVIYFGVLCLLVSCLAAEAADSAQFTGTERIFGLANVVTLKYIPPARIAVLQRSPGIDEIRDRWVFSISTKCPSSCMGWPGASKVQEFISTGGARIEGCSLPYFAILGFNSTMSAYSADIYISADGRCFTIDGESYDSAINIMEFLDNDVISIFSNFPQ